MPTHPTPPPSTDRPPDDPGKWTAPDGLYFRYASALHDADTHSCQLGEGVQYSVLLSAITSVRDEEMGRLRVDLDEARATVARVRHALMSQSYSTSLENTLAEALDGTGEQR